MLSMLACVVDVLSSVNPNPHKLMRGEQVTSNAPSVFCATCVATVNTDRKMESVTTASLRLTREMIDVLSNGFIE